MPGTLVFLPDSRYTGRQILSRVESLPPHPKGCPLVCLVETPGGGGGGGQQEQQSPHHCPGGAFLREGRGATLGTRTAPTSPASTVLLSSPTALTEQLLGEPGGTSVSWRTSLCLLEATPELALSPWGRCPFYHTYWAPALPLQVLGAGGRGRAERILESVLAAASPSCSSPSLGRCSPEEGRAQPTVCVLHCKLTWIIAPENSKGLQRDERAGEVVLEWALGLLA